jgi:hypothetical protein
MAMDVPDTRPRMATTSTGTITGSIVELRRSLALTLWTLLLLAAALLWQRRLRGAWDPAALGAGACGLWVGMAMTLAGGGGLAYRGARDPTLTRPMSPPTHWWPETVTVALALLAIGPVIPVFSGGMVIFLVGLTTVIGLMTWWIPLVDRVAARPAVEIKPPQATSHLEVPAPIVEQPVVEQADVPSAGSLESPSEADSEALQTMSRRWDDELEIAEGELQIDFAPAQREQSVHLAFCPGLAAAPELELEPVEALDWDLKVAAVYPFGARLTIRRRPDAPLSGRIAYCATAPRRAA